MNNGGYKTPINVTADKNTSYPRMLDTKYRRYDIIIWRDKKKSVVYRERSGYIGFIYASKISFKYPKVNLEP